MGVKNGTKGFWVGNTPTNTVRKLPDGCMLLGKWRTVTTRKWTSPSVPVAGPPEFENRFVHLTGCRPDPGIGFRGKVTGCRCGNYGRLPEIPTITCPSYEYPPIPDAMDRFTHYQSEIRKQYEAVKKGPMSTYLDPPGQANLRDLCLELCQKADGTDREIYRRFMGEDYDPKRWQAVKKKTNQFRSISNFFNGTSETFADKKNADMAALLVDFRPRPYWKFAGGEDVTVTTPSEILDDSSVVRKGATNELPIGDQARMADASSLRRWRWMLPLAGILLLGIGFWWVLRTPGAGCMQWQGDHYERVDCGADGSQQTVLGFDENQFVVRRVEVCDTTTFFRKGKPVLWYLKHDNTYDFFDHPGYHPEFIDRRLKPVSRYIARRKELGVRN